MASDRAIAQAFREATVCRHPAGFVASVFAEINARAAEIDATPAGDQREGDRAAAIATIEALRRDMKIHPATDAAYVEALKALAQPDPAGVVLSGDARARAEAAMQSIGQHAKWRAICEPRSPSINELNEWHAIIAVLLAAAPQDGGA